jgi:hypothetical protein
MKKLCIVSLTMILFCSGSGFSLPRFAIRTNEKCQNCHIDPNGGGMRNYYGSTLYARKSLSADFWSDDSSFDNFTTQLSEYVNFGSDLQTLYYYRQLGNSSSFFQMKGDIYLTTKLTKNLFVYLDKGLYSGFEIFGYMNILPANGYVKIGRFTPAFGTKTDDHTTFIRAKTDFINGRREDTGIEVGISPKNFTWNIGVYNGSTRNDYSDGKIRLLTSRIDAKFQIEDIKLLIGGSAWLNNLAGGKFTMFGGFGGVSYKNLVLNGEIDIKKNNSALGTKELISLIEANYLITNGVDLKLMYDYYDPNIEYKTGMQSRYSIGLEFFPMYGVELRPMYRIVKEEPNEVRNNEFHFLIHFYL